MRKESRGSSQCPIMSHYRLECPEGQCVDNAAMAVESSRLADLLDAEADLAEARASHGVPSAYVPLPRLTTGWSENWDSCLDENAPVVLEEGWIRVRDPQLSWAWQWVQTALRVIPVELRKQGCLLFAAVGLAISEGEGLTRARAWWGELRRAVSSGRRVEMRAGGFVL